MYPWAALLISHFQRLTYLVLLVPLAEVDVEADVLTTLFGATVP